MVTTKKGTPKKTASKPKRELEKNGIPKCLWSKIDGLASTFVENESDASDLKNKVTFTNKSISIRDKEGNKKDYVLFSASEKKLAEFAAKINEWSKTTKSLDLIPDELLKALSKEAKENIINIERIHKLDFDKKPNFSNKLTNDGNSLLLRDGLGYGKFDIHIYYDERSLEKINKFASKVNELYKPSPKPIETKEKKSEEISTELHENGMPKYIWERLSEKAKDNCINLKLLKNWTYKQVTNKITYTNFSITLRDEFGDEGVLYSYNKPKDFNGFIEKANKFYENLKEKEKEEPSVKVDLVTKKEGIPKYIWDGLSEEARKNLLDVSVLDNSINLDEKLTYNKDDILLRAGNWELVTFHGSTKETYDKFIKTANDFYANKLLSKKEKEKKEKEEIFDLLKDKTADGIPKYIWDKLCKKAKENLVHVHQNVLINKLTYNINSIFLRKNDGNINGGGIVFSETSRQQVDEFIEKTNEYFNKEIIPPNQFPLELWKTLPNDVKAEIETSELKYRIMMDMVPTHASFCIEETPYFKFELTNLTTEGKTKFCQAVTTLVRERMPATEKITVRGSGITFGKVLLDEAVNRLSLWDYFNNETISFSKQGFQQSQKKGNIKPGRLLSDDSWVSNWESLSKETHFKNLLEEIEVEDPVTSHKFRIPKFIYDRAKNKCFISYDTFTVRKSRYNKFLSEITEPVYIIDHKSTRYGFVEIQPGDFLAAKNSRLEHCNWWLEKKLYLSYEDNPRITHIDFIVDKNNQAIVESAVFVNGEQTYLPIAFKTKSDSIDKFKTMVFDKTDKDGIPCCLSDLLPKNYTFSKSYTSISVKDLSKGHTSEYIRLTDIYSLQDIEKAKRIIQEFISDIETPKAEEKDLKEVEKEEAVKVKEPEIKQEEVKEVAPIIVTANVPVSKLSSIAALDSAETIKRLVSMNITSMVQNLLLELLTEKTGKQKQELLKTKLKEFFKTSNGKTLIQLLVSGLIPHVLSHIPEKYREQVSSISDELRIQGETETVMFILDKVSNTISGKIITEFLNKNELVRIDVSNNTNTSENRTLTSGREDFNLYELQSSPLVSEKSAVVK